jgi:probable rRNA maturation factor
MILSFTLLKTTTVPKGALSTADYEALAAFALGRQKVKGPVELSVDITGHKRIQDLNRRFRGVDRTTDVISFRNDTEFRDEGRGTRKKYASSPLSRPSSLSGDLAINVHQAALQAKKMRHPLKREMRLLLIHGILHLMGYTDYEPKPRRRMFKRQNAILRSWEAAQR